MYDAVIIGAGHNGLVTAFYLARAGLHPWGEVNGGPGYNAAQRILAEDVIRG